MTTETPLTDADIRERVRNLEPPETATVEVEVDDLVGVIEWVNNDPALDSAPPDSELLHELDGLLDALTCPDASSDRDRRG